MTEASQPIVLLVDDEPRILSALQRILRREPFEILVANNARDALDELETREINLVVSDYKMPGISGIDLLKRIATHWPTTGRILLSGWSNEIAEDELESARLHSVVMKPWDEVVLKTAIRTALSTRPAPSRSH